MEVRNDGRCAQDRWLETAFNARSKASMRAYLKSRTWPEKIESIERMNEAARLAREGMRRTRGRMAAASERVS
jgi:hypothetical protein